MSALDTFEAARARLVDEYERKLSRLDRAQDAHWKALEVTEAWSASKPDRTSRVYLGEGHVMVHLGLAPPDIFADAEEAFDAAQTALRACFPSDWVGDWTTVEDGSNAHEARRTSTLGVCPDGSQWYHDGVLVSLTVGAWISEQTACRVVQIGTREVTDRVESKRVVPIFKAVCPGDPMLAAE